MRAFSRAYRLMVGATKLGRYGWATSSTECEYLYSFAMRVCSANEDALAKKWLDATTTRAMAPVDGIDCVVELELFFFAKANIPDPIMILANPFLG